MMAGDTVTERDLYAPASRFLYVSFLLKLRANSAHENLQLFASDTSSVPHADGGQWTRPDLAALVLAKGQFVPHWRADLHTFEVKTAKGLSETAVHEANAHGRFANYAWLVFHASGKAEIKEDGLARKVMRLAAHLGVGVIHFVSAENPHTWEISVWPRRTGTDLATTDNFVRERFSPEVKEQILRNLKSHGWGEA